MSSINVTYRGRLGLPGSCSHCLLRIKRILLFPQSEAGTWLLSLGSSACLKVWVFLIAAGFLFTPYVHLSTLGFRSTLCLDHCVKSLYLLDFQPVYIWCWLPCDPISRGQLWDRLFPPCINITHAPLRPPGIGPGLPCRCINKHIHTPATLSRGPPFHYWNCFLSQWGRLSERLKTFLRGFGPYWRFSSRQFVPNSNQTRFSLPF